MKKLLVLAITFLVTMAAFVTPIAAQASNQDGDDGMLKGRPGLAVRVPQSVVIGEERQHHSCRPGKRQTGQQGGGVGSPLQTKRN